MATRAGRNVQRKPRISAEGARGIESLKKVAGSHSSVLKSMLLELGHLSRSAQRYSASSHVALLPRAPKRFDMRISKVPRQSRMLSWIHLELSGPILRCLGARDSNHDPLANRIASESDLRDLRRKKNKCVKNGKDITAIRTDSGGCDTNRPTVKQCCEPMAIRIAANPDGPISLDIAMLSLRFPISRDICSGMLTLPKMVRYPLGA